MDVRWERSALQDALLARRLRSGIVAIPVEAYSNDVGRAFRGFGYLKVTSSSLASGVNRGGDSAGSALTAAPNPFNPSTVLQFRSEAAGDVALRVFDARGALVRTLLEQWLPAGEHEARWDGRDRSGAGVATGFIIHFASDVVYALGLSARIPVPLSAWSPAIIGCLLGAAILFHLEDG